MWRCCVRPNIYLQGSLEMTSESATSHLELYQLGLGQPELAAAAMHAVLRVTAAEDSSRQCRSFFVSSLSGRVTRFDGEQADSFGSASFGNICCRPELTPLQPGMLLKSACRCRQPALAWHVQEMQSECALAVQDLRAHPQHAACVLPSSLAVSARLGG